MKKEDHEFSSPGEMQTNKFLLDIKEKQGERGESFYMPNELCGKDSSIHRQCQLFGNRER